jgi:hypothetical protein
MIILVLSYNSMTRKTERCSTRVCSSGECSREENEHHFNNNGACRCHDRPANIYEQTAGDTQSTYLCVCLCVCVGWVYAHVNVCTCRDNYTCTRDATAKTLTLVKGQARGAVVACVCVCVCGGSTGSWGLNLLR